MSAQPHQRRRRALLVAGALTTVLSVPAALPALAGAAPATISGAPLTLTVEDLGNVQAKVEDQSYNLFYRSGNEVGGAQFFLGFPAPVRADLTEEVAGPDLNDGRADFLYTPVSQAGGAGTSSPFQVTTVYRVDGSAGEQLLQITQTVTYTNGAKRFGVSYAVRNVSASPIRYRASAGVDLFESEDGIERGFGFTDGPPLLLGGQETASRRWVAVEQATQWSHYQTGLWSTIWSAIGNPKGAGFADSVNEAPSSIDHGTGVQWDGNYAPGAGLGAGKTETYSLAWRTDVKPAAPDTKRLTISPSTASQTVGRGHSISMKADGQYWPLSNKTVRYEVKGANPSVGSATTDAFGIATKSLSGPNAGVDDITAYVDLDGNSIKGASEPSASAKVTWTATAPGSPGTGTPPAGSDGDGDGVPGAADACPTIAASTSDGCPPGAGPALSSATSAIRAAFKRLGLKRLYQGGAASFVFRAPSSGALSVTGTAGVRGGVASGRLVLLAGKRTFRQAGQGKVKLKLTKKGKRSLKRARKARIALKLVFKNGAGRTFRKNITVTVRRR